MTNPTIKIHNTETGEEIERAMTKEEIAQYELDKAESEAKAKAIKEKEQLKTSLLERLGITEDEAKALLA